MKICQQYARTLYGIETRVEDKPALRIGETWERFLMKNIADEIPARVDDNLVALYCDYEGDQRQAYTYFLGCEVLDVCSAEEGFAIRYTPVANYAEFHVEGEMPRTLFDKWREIQRMGLDRSYLADFEIHDPASREKVSIYVGVKS